MSHYKLQHHHLHQHQHLHYVKVTHHHRAIEDYQASNNAVIVREPTVVKSYRTHPRPSGDHYLTLSICLTVFCFLFGSWIPLICFVPAIIFAASAHDAEERGDYEAVNSNRTIALWLNICGITISLLGIIAIVIIVLVAMKSSSSPSDSTNYYYNNNYNYNYCYSYYNYYYDTYGYYC